MKEFYFTKDGTIAYLVLTNAKRFQLRIADSGPTTDDLDAVRPVPDRPEPAIHTIRSLYQPLLVIEGSSIHNVVFESVDDVRIGPGDATRLDDAVSRHRIRRT